MRLRLNSALALAVLVIVLLATLPLYVNEFVVRMLVLVWIYSLLTIGQNLITGYTGMLSMGQAAYYGIGAYTSALLTLHLGMPWPLALILSGTVACVFGIVLGFPCVRLSSDYLTLMTIGFNVIASLVFLNWMDVTQGPMGLSGLPSPSIGPVTFRTVDGYYYLYLIILGIVYLFIKGLIRSKHGRALIAIRDNELSAASVGINVSVYKLLSFGLASFLAGISGSMLAHFIKFVGPSTFKVDESILHMQMAILGGLGSLPGSVVGAAILTIVPQVLQVVYEYRMLINGVVMVGLMIWRPQGLLGGRAAGRIISEKFKDLFGKATGAIGRSRLG
jgi:branched-chain amino acid transport system permease protein